MSRKTPSVPRALHRTLILAGIAGAVAELVWVGLFCGLTPLSGAEVLRQVTASVIPGTAGAAWAPAFGLVVHFALGVAIAYAFGLAVWRHGVRRNGPDATLAVSVIGLAAIWAFNFFVLLPFLNPDFVRLMPHGFTFESQLLFGLVMGSVLNARTASARVRSGVMMLQLAPSRVRRHAR